MNRSCRVTAAVTAAALLSLTAAYAKGGQKDGELHYVLPSFMHDKVDGKQLLVGATVDEYTGPGTYGTDQLTDRGTPAGIDIDGKLYFEQAGRRAKPSSTPTAAAPGPSPAWTCRTRTTLRAARRSAAG